MTSDSRAAWRGYLALALVGVAVLVAVGAGIVLLRQPAPSPIEILPPATVAPTATTAPLASPVATPRPLRVDVAGAVVAPGVYRLPPDSIVADAIAAAGGPAGDADLDRLNKAVALVDGMQVYVPHASAPTPDLITPVLPPPTVASRAGTLPSGAGAVNINNASQAELEALPGIGPTLAERIIAARPFARIEDLLEVKGVGPAVFGGIRDLVTVQ